MNDLDGGKPDERTQTDPEFTMPQSRALIPMLVVAALAVLVILLNITGAKPVLAPVGTAADRAFSPKDFAAVFEEQARIAASSREGKDGLFPVPPPPFNEDLYPCSTCHDEKMEVNRERRELSFHDDIVLHHDEANRWCLDCHDGSNRDRLHLAGGTLLPFEESYKLCGQCHGTQFRDWRAGIHGKRTGHWNGDKQYLLCVNCHNPHSPHFAPIKPLPPPVRPQFLRSAHAAVADAAPSDAITKESSDGRTMH